MKMKKTRLWRGGEMGERAATREHPLDLLQSIGRIGAVKATASLSALAGKPVENSYAHVMVVPLEEVPGLFGDPEEMIAGIIFGVSGDISGQFVVVFPMQDAVGLIKALTGADCSLESELGEMELSALSETGNILASSYLAAIETTTGLAVTPSPPALAVDMAGGILTTAVVPMHEAGSEILLIEARFGGERELGGRMILLPSTASLPRLLRAVGVLG